MAVRFNTAIRNTLADSWATALNGGTLKIYTGGQPTNGGDTATGTLLATINLPATAFSAAASGSAAKTGTWSATIAATGTAGWFRFTSSDGTKIFDGLIGTDLNIDNVSLIAGGTITVSTYTLTQPAA